MSAKVPTDLVDFAPFVGSDLHTAFAIVLLTAGIIFTMMFFVYEIRATESRNRSIFAEMILALLSSVLLGEGTLFLLLVVGIYV
eukprot:JP448668.1.p1 GENE.JP448668.1~~JP448668.1.p1  ORF type:complete len:93 (+),score=16.54 JP448668.1:29-280(+)